MQVMTIKRLERRIIFDPMLLRSLCDRQEELQKDMQCEIRSTRRGCRMISRLCRQAASHILECTCSGNTRTIHSHRAIRQKPFYWLRPGSHDLSCPVYRVSRKAQYLETGINFCSSYLGFSVQATMSITKGAGGVSIGSRLNVRNIVPFNSPAFACLSKGLKARQDKDSDGWERSTLQHILQLFNEGKAAPSDVDPYGRTLLHVRVD